MQGAGRADRDDTARLHSQGGGDGDDRGDLANAATQEGDWMCIDSADEQRAIGEARERERHQVTGKRLKGGALLAECGGDERGARRAEVLLHGGRIAGWICLP